MIEIRFHKSTSKSYKDVLKQCRHFPVFEEGDPNVLKIPDAESLYTHWEEFNHIFHTVKRWAGCTVLYNGKSLAPYRVLSDWFYSIQELKYCYFTFYKQSYDKQNYCNDGGCWGCKKLKSIERYIQLTFWPVNYWYHYGSFVSDSVWQVNKEHIWAVLLEEANQKRLDFCPVFNPSVIDNALRRLPNTIYIDNVNWRIRYITDYLEYGPVDIPDGIEHMEMERKVYPQIRQLQDEVIPFNFSPQRDANPNNITDEDADRMIDEYLKKKNA
jgi:hypothetical protein